MIHLTDQQVQELERPDLNPPRVVNPRTQKRFVLLPEEDYQRLTAYDDGSWTDEERDLLRAEALDHLGWEGMDAYQDDQP